MTNANEKLKEIEKLIKINKKCCPDCRSYNEFLKEEKKSILLGLESARNGHKFIIQQLETKVVSYIKRDEEIRKLVNEDKIANATYEQVIQGIESEPNLANKDRAKFIVGEIYGKAVSNQELENEISRLTKSGILTNQDIRISLRKAGYSDAEINASSIGGIGSMTESIIKFLFK